MLYRNCSQYHVPLKFKTMFTCVDQDKNVTNYPEGWEARHQFGHDHGVQREVGGEWGGGRAGEDNGHCVSVWYPRPLRFWYPRIGGRWWGWHSVLGRGRAHQEGVTVSGGGAGYHDLMWLWSLWLVSLDYTHLFPASDRRRRAESTHWDTHIRVLVNRHYAGLWLGSWLYQ